MLCSALSERYRFLAFGASYFRREIQGSAKVEKCPDVENIRAKRLFARVVGGKARKREPGQPPEVVKYISRHRSIAAAAKSFEAGMSQPPQTPEEKKQGLLHVKQKRMPDFDREQLGCRLHRKTDRRRPTQAKEKAAVTPDSEGEAEEQRCRSEQKGSEQQKTCCSVLCTDTAIPQKLPIGTANCKLLPIGFLLCCYRILYCSNLTGLTTPSFGQCDVQ